MNITSSCKSLRLILVFCSCCLFFLNALHAQHGEQDNWYLAKKLHPELSFSLNSDLWKDPRDETYKMIHINSSYGFGDSSFDITDFSNNTLSVEFSLQGNTDTYQFDDSTSYSLESPVKITEYSQFIVLSDDSLLIGANVEFNWGLENPHSIPCLLHASLVNETAVVVKAGSFPFAVGGDNKILLGYFVDTPSEDFVEGGPSSVLWYEVAQAEFSSSGQISLSTEDSFTIPSGTSPGMLYNPGRPQLTFDNRIAFLDNSYLNFYDSTGKFLNRVDLINIEGLGQFSRDTQNTELRTGIKGLFLTKSAIYDQFGQLIFSFNANQLGAFNDSIAEYNFLPCMTNEGNLILKVNIEESDGGGGTSYSSEFQQWNRAYRTKGLPEPNAIPQPLVHSVKQRAGTNILDIDFEIVDPDDDTTKVGFLANVAQPDSENSEDSGLSGNNIEFGNENIFYGGDYPMIIPSSWVEGTDAKIGTSISTNQVHRVSWYVKGDWNQLYGELKIGIFAQDARREKPVDVHFLTLPVGNSTLTISRSEITTGFKNYILYKLSVGELKFGTRNIGLPLAEEELGERSVLLRESDEEILAYDSAGAVYTQAAYDYFIEAFGEGYRWATEHEIKLAREAATPDLVNSFPAKNQIKPRGLPGAVNEYGFDTSGAQVGNYIVKEN